MFRSLIKMIKSLWQGKQGNLTDYQMTKFFHLLMQASVMKLCKRCRQRLHREAN
jgi:hypothetical protein